MSDSTHEWDFFIAYPSGNQDVADALCDQLEERHCKVFLDHRQLVAGDDWDQELPKALKSSRITVVLVSNDTDEAYYEREEIRLAINLSRDKVKNHRVVPVYLNEDAKRTADEIYGLQLKHGLDWNGDDGAEQLGTELCEVLRFMMRGKKPRRQSRSKTAKGDTSSKKAVTVAGVAVVLSVLSFGAWILDIFEGPLDEYTDIYGPPGAGGTNAATSIDPCVVVNPLSPKLIPYYLLNSVGNVNFPYWLKLTARNTCDEVKVLKVRFDTGENVVLEGTERSFSLRPDGETHELILHPKFRLASPETRRVSIDWSVETEDGRKLVVRSIDTEIVPPYKLAWDLTKPSGQGENGEPVDDAYLLASLSAWTLKPPKMIREHGERCRKPDGRPTKLRKRAALEACYEYLFADGGKVRVYDDLVRFPEPNRRQDITPHVRVIENGEATSLEAALLYVAVLDARHVDGIDPDLILVVTPESDEGDRKQKSVFLAWREPGGWQAINLRRASSQVFDQNVVDATRIVGPIMKHSSEITNALFHGTGAGFSANGEVAAVSFHDIDPAYKIRKLDIFK